MASSYKVKQGNIFGRIGSGIGQGLAEQLPKEVERGRLSSGLQQLEQEAPNLSPMQFLTRSLAIPGMTPEMTRQLGEFAKQQGFSNALQNISSQENVVQPAAQSATQMPQAAISKAPSITKREPLEATLKPYIPLGQQERIKMAQEKYPDLWKQDFNKALALVDQAEDIKKEQNQALQTQRKNELAVQENLQKELGKQKDLFAGDIPSRTYQNIENKAFNSILPEEEGGEDLTEREAAIKYGKILDNAKRDYDLLKGVGSSGFLLSGPKSIVNRLNTIRKGFEERDDLENLADSFISETGLSPGRSYYLTYPNEEHPKVNKILKSIPDLPKTRAAPGGSFTAGSISPKNRIKIQLDAFTKLAENLGDASPLAIGEDLRNKGYDVAAWFDYLSKNQDFLKLDGRQRRELGKDRGLLPTLNDIFLFFGMGKQKLVE